MTRLTAALGAAFALAIPSSHLPHWRARLLVRQWRYPDHLGRVRPMFDAVGEPGGTSLVRMGFLSTGNILYRIDANGTTSTTVGSSESGAYRSRRGAPFRRPARVHHRLRRIELRGRQRPRRLGSGRRWPLPAAARPSLRHERVRDARWI
jgi:hypothetical protein